MAGATPLAPARRPRRRRHLRGRGLPLPRRAGRRVDQRGGRRRTRRRPVAPGAGGVAAAGGPRRGRGRAVVRRAARPPRPPARPGPPDWPSCSAPTPPTGPSCCGPGGRAAPGRRRGPGVAARAVAAAARADRRPRIPPSGSTRRARPCAPIPRVVALPERLSLFGPTRLAAQELAVLAALGEHRDVHLWLPHPSPALWATVRARPGVPPRAADPTADAAAHPLLSSLGRDVRELQVRLTAAVPGLVDHHHPCPDPPPTLLGRLQRDLRDDRPPVSPVVPDATRSVQVHACHGPDRQVEVLREVVLGLLEDDPTLEPRDVLVMCPDIETFAPLISAAFGPGAHPAQALPVRLADRALRQINPLLDVVARLLELADARLTAARGARPARRRARAQALRPRRRRPRPAARARRRLRRALGPRRRAPAAVQAGGVPAEHLGGRARPAAARRRDAGRRVAGHRAARGGRAGRHRARSGRLAEFVDRLAGVLGELSGEQPLAEWTTTLGHARWTLLTATTATDAWQAVQARAELAEAAHVAGPHAAHGAARPRRRPRPARRAAARPAHPRELPHRHPHRLHAGADALGAAPGGLPARARRRRVPARGRGRRRRRAGPRARCVGERDPRSEDRQLLLDAIMAATEHAGRPLLRAPTSAPALRRPPAVPLGELLDAVAATAAGRRRRRPPPAAAVRRPQLHARPRPFSFDRAELAGARAAAGPRRRAAAVPARPAPRPAPGTVALDDLVAFLEHPVKGFLRQRVGLSMYAGDEAPADALPVALDGLASGRSATGCCGDRLAGRDLDRCRQAEWRRGELPPGALGDAAARRACSRTSSRWSRRRAESGWARPPTGTSTWSCPTAPAWSARSAGCTGDTARARRVLAARRQAPAAGVGAAGGAHRGHRTSRGGRSRSGAGRAVRHRRAIVGPVAAGRGPRRCWPSWSRCATAGLCAPLPLSTVTALRLRPRPTRRRRRAGRRAGRGRRGRGRTARVAERDDPAHVRVWGRAAPASVLADEPGPPGGEPTRFGALAWALWRRCCRWRTWCADDRRSRARRVRRLRPAAHRHHRARGQRRHRQDVHHRRARRPLRRRGRRARCRSCCSSPSAGRPPRSCASGCASGWWPPSARWPTPRRPAPGGDTVLALLADAPDAEVAAAPARGCARARRRSTPRPSPPPTSSASRCSPGSAWPADADPDAVFVESVDDLVVEVVDDLYVRKFGDRGGRAAAVRPRRPRCELARGRGRRPAGPAGAVPPRSPGSVAATRLRFAAAVRAEVERRKRRAARPQLRRPAHPPRRRAAPTRPAARGPAAGALPGGAGRRVPGHRPGAVGDPAPRLPRAHARWC